jgi:uncharacterized protein
MAKRPEDDEKGPERTCIATRDVRPIAELIRFAVSPDGVLTPDIKGKLPGRGVWVTGVRPAVEEALRRKAFTRSLKMPVTTPDGLVDLVERLLRDDARQFLSIANKAGLVICGFAKVESALASSKVIAVLSAAEGGEDGKRKILQAVRRRASDGPAPLASYAFSGSELDLALGRENAIHAALLAGPAGDAFLARVARLEKFQHGGPGEVRPDAGDQPASTGPFALEND